MSKVIQLFPTKDVPECLRGLAGGIESGDIIGDECTIICGTRIFHFGADTDERASEQAVWNLTYGIHTIMDATSRGIE